MNKFLVLFLISISFFLSAQTTVNKVYVLNEGHYDYTTQTQLVPVTVGYFDFNTRVYNTIDTIVGARFGTSIIANDRYIYAAADNSISQYDILTGIKVGQIGLPGVRKMAFIGPYLVTTHGEYRVRYSANITILYSHDLGWAGNIDTLTGPKRACEGIAAVGTDIYVVENNGFEFGAEVGTLWKLDLIGFNITGSYDLSPQGKNPGSLFYLNSKLYSFNSRDYINSSISEYTPGGTVTTTYDLFTTAGSSSSTIYNSNIAYQIIGSNDVSIFNVGSHTTSLAFSLPTNLYGMTQDIYSGNIYGGITDSNTFGRIVVYDSLGIPIDSFETSVAPVNLVLMYGPLTSGISNVKSGIKYNIFPNPSSSEINLSGYNGKSEIEIWNGINLISTCHTPQINVVNLSAGLYYLRYLNQILPFVKIE